MGSIPIRLRHFTPHGHLCSWGRLRVEHIAGKRFPDGAERLAPRIAGSLLLGLALVIAASATWRLRSGAGQSFSAPGLAIAVMAIPVMTLLARAKLHLAAQAFIHAWWVDAVGATLLLPLLVKEGVEGWRDEDARDDDG